jgi:tripartite-type tricarboxylate transporter receptor subunit TctC
MQPVQRIHRRALLAGATAFACGGLLAQGAWPAKPIRLVVPFPAGGSTDVAARVVAQALGDTLGTSVFVDNKGGAHGFIGATDAARSAPDGHTLMMASIGTMAINPRLYPKLPYDPNQDFQPLSLVLTVPIALVVNPAVLPVQSVAELVAYLKAHPGKVNYASAGAGGSSHLVPEYFKFRAGVHMTHIPYKGGGPAVADLVSGQVQVMFDTLLTSTPFVKSGKLRMLGVTTAQRLPQFPDVPTIAEALGMGDFEASSWYAMYAPAGTPASIVERLSQAVDEVLKQPAVARRMEEFGAVPVGGTPGQLARFQRSEQDKWGKVVVAAGVRLQ